MPCRPPHRFTSCCCRGSSRVTRCRPPSSGQTRLLCAWPCLGTGGTRGDGRQPLSLAEQFPCASHPSTTTDLHVVDHGVGQVEHQNQIATPKVQPFSSDLSEVWSDIRGQKGCWQLSSANLSCNQHVCGAALELEHGPLLLLHVHAWGKSRWIGIARHQSKREERMGREAPSLAPYPG